MGRIEPVAIIGEGITEKYYLQSLKGSQWIRPNYKYYEVTSSSAKGYEDKIKEAIGDGYTTIYCMFDMDVQCKDERSHEKYVRLRQKYHNKKKKEIEILFFESFPSTEVFFRYYFEYTTAVQTNDGLKHWLRDKVGYDVKEKYFARNPLHDVFCRNQGCLEGAIRNSIRSVESREPDNFACCYTEIGSMIELLRKQEE